MDSSDTPSSADKRGAPEEGSRDAGGDPGDVRHDDVRHAAAGGGTNLLAVVAGLLLPVYHTLVARLYGAAVYGTYSLGLGITELGSRLAAVGTDKGVLRHIPSHRIANEPQLEQRSLATAFWLTLLGGTILAAVAYAFAGPLARAQGKPETLIAIRFLAPSTPFAGLVVVLISATMAAKTMRYNLLVRGLAQPALLILVALPVGVFGPSLFNLCISHLGATIVTALLAWWAAVRVFREMPLTRAIVRGPPHWEMVNFSVWLGLSEFLNAVLQRADLILLSLYVSEVRIGHYAGAELLSRAVSNARYAFDPVASPIISESLRQNDRERLSYNLQLMTRWVTLLTFPIVTFVLGFRDTLLGLFGQSFLAAGSAFIVLNVGHVFNATLGLTGWVIGMSGRSKLILVNNLLASATNITLCFFLLERYELFGAALASAISVTFGQSLQVLEVAWLERISPFGKGLVKVFIAGGVTLAAMIYLGPQLPGPVWLRLAYGTVGLLLLYGLLLAILGLEQEERDIATRWIGKLRRR